MMRFMQVHSGLPCGFLLFWHEMCYTYLPASLELGRATFMQTVTCLLGSLRHCRAESVHCMIAPIPCHALLCKHLACVSLCSGSSCHDACRAMWLAARASGGAQAEASGLPRKARPLKC